MHFSFCATTNGTMTGSSWKPYLSLRCTPSLTLQGLLATGPDGRQQCLWKQWSAQITTLCKTTSVVQPPLPKSVRLIESFLFFSFFFLDAALYLVFVPYISLCCGGFGSRPFHVSPAHIDAFIALGTGSDASFVFVFFFAPGQRLAFQAERTEHYRSCILVCVCGKFGEHPRVWAEPAKTKKQKVTGFVELCYKMEK